MESRDRWSRTFIVKPRPVIAVLQEWTAMSRTAQLEKHRWIPFVLPLLVFMAVGSLEPTPKELGGAFLGLAIPYAAYPWVYLAKIALTAAAMLFVLPGYRQFPLRAGPLAVAVGLLGMVVWIALCKLNLEQRFLGPLGLGKLLDLGARSGYNPLEQLPLPACAWGFLAVRLFGLVVVVALAEEFFLRGWLMRWVMAAEWWNVPFGKVNTVALLVAPIYGVLTHPAELVAAAVWFSMVTWLMVKTRNIWDCVLAHAVTNLALGIYVAATGQWQLM